MPFTASHPAAVLPLLGTPLVASALVIGSMSPDLPYFVPVPVAADLAHSLLGILTVDLLLGLAAYLVWHAVLARPAAAASPASARTRLAPVVAPAFREKVWPPLTVLIVVVSVVVGSITHVVWDEFTHPDRWGTEHLPWLAGTHGAFTGYHWAQYASSIVGLLVIAVWLLLWWRRAPAVRAHGEAPVAVAVAIVPVPAPLAVAGWSAVVLGGLVGAVLGVLARSDGSAASLGYQVSTWGGAGAGLVAIALGTAWTVHRTRVRF